MNLMFAGSGLAIVALSWTWYLALIPAEKVPRQPLLHIAGMLLGMALAAVGAAGLGLVPVILAASAWLLGGFFLFLLGQANLPDGELVVTVGDPLPAFSAADGTGSPVASSEWQGQRLLLKFFRGSW